MYRVKYGSKYGAKRKTYGGRTYHSKKEAGVAQEFDLMLKGKAIKKVRPQVKLPLDVNGNHVCNYYIDFEITHNDDTIEYVEVKGFETQTWRLKWKLFEALYKDKVKKGEVKLTVLK